MLRKHLLLLLSSLVVIICATFVTTSPVPAHAASHAIDQEENCAIVLAPLRPGERTSRVLSSQCVTGNHPLVVSSNLILLIQLFSDNNWKGKGRAYYVPHPCSKTTGYAVANTHFKNTHSFYASNRCYHTRAFTKTNFGGRSYTWNYNPRYVGAPWRSSFNSFFSLY